MLVADGAGTFHTLTIKKVIFLAGTTSSSVNVYPHSGFDEVAFFDGLKNLTRPADLQRMLNTFHI